MTRILIINGEYPPIGGGAGNASANLAKELVSLGQDVIVLTAHFGNLSVDTIEGGVRVLRIKSLRRQKDRSGALEQSIFMLKGILGLRILQRDWRPDAIIAFFGVPSGAIAWLNKIFTKIPYLVSLRGGDVPGFRPYDFAVYHRLIGPLLHQVWRKADAVIANSQGLKVLGEAFDNTVDIKVIPNGVDIHRYQVEELRDWENPRLLWVGRMVYQKGLDILFDALAMLKSIPWTLTLVGDGPYRPKLEKMAIDKGMADRINFAGWLDREVLSHNYHEANLFVFPSRHEGMPNAVLEAMACGLPVIASNIAGNEELIIKEQTGLLVPAEDPMALYKALRRLIPDATQKKEMGQASRTRVEDHYTWERVARQYLNIILDYLRLHS